MSDWAVGCNRVAQLQGLGGNSCRVDRVVQISERRCRSHDGLACQGATGGNHQALGIVEPGIGYGNAGEIAIVVGDLLNVVDIDCVEGQVAEAVEHCLPLGWGIEIPGCAAGGCDSVAPVDVADLETIPRNERLSDRSCLRVVEGILQQSEGVGIPLVASHNIGGADQFDFGSGGGDIVRIDLQPLERIAAIECCIRELDNRTGEFQLEAVLIQHAGCVLGPLLRIGGPRCGVDQSVRTNSTVGNRAALVVESSSVLQPMAHGAAILSHQLQHIAGRVHLQMGHGAGIERQLQIFHGRADLHRAGRGDRRDAGDHSPFHVARAGGIRSHGHRLSLDRNITIAFDAAGSADRHLAGGCEAEIGEGGEFAAHTHLTSKAEAGRDVTLNVEVAIEHQATGRIQ